MSDQNKQFTPEQQEYLARFERQVTTAETTQWLQITRDCKNKFQFAKTYRVLRKDFARTNQELRDKASRGDVGEGITPELVEEMIRIGTTHWEEDKMGRLKAHFEATWGEPIENYAGKGDGAGCVGIVVSFMVIAVIGVFIASLP